MSVPKTPNIYNDIYITTHTQRLGKEWWDSSLSSHLNFHKDVDVQLQYTKYLLGYIALTCPPGGQLFLQGENVQGKGELEGPFTKTEQLASTHSPSTSKRCQTARSQRRPAPLSRGPGRCPWYWQRSSPCVEGTPRELWSRLLYCIVWHPRLLLSLSDLLWAPVWGVGTGQLAGWLLAQQRHCAVPKPPPRTPLRETSCLEPALFLSHVALTCCLSWAGPHPELLSPVALWRSQGESCFWLSMVHSLCPLTCVSHSERKHPHRFHYLPNVCLKGFSRRAPHLKSWCLDPDDSQKCSVGWGGERGDSDGGDRLPVSKETVERKLHWALIRAYIAQR